VSQNKKMVIHEIPMWFHRACLCVAAMACLVTADPAHSRQAPSTQQAEATLNDNVRQRANGVLAIMSYTTVPDVTTSSLSINNAATGSPAFAQTQFGGGFTVSRSVPLYLEGTLAYSRYDPTFIATNGAEQRALPLRWNTFSSTVGIGWDFPVASELVLRPILNGTIGRVASDLKLGQTVVNQLAGTDFSFLDSGALNAYGYGGSLMLDFEHHREKYEIDVEARLTDIALRSFGASSKAVQGHANAQQFGLWTRWRAPTQFTALGKPVRYVLEGAYTHYFGDSGDVLGFNDLTSLGVGLELDSSQYPVVITRTRAMLRYVFGHNVQGVSLGCAVSF
jgi:hypothetical protein